ncbi:MAG: efflux RND transporter permease subunit [Pseudomonadales bacterium]
MIRFFTDHPTAANLTMILLLAMGAVSAPNIIRSTFPRVPLDQVEVSIPYPGAAPAEVEQAVCRRLEDAVDRVTDIWELTCEARENIAIARVEANEGTSIDRFVSDIRTEVDAIDDLPDTTESPVIRILNTTEPVVSIAASGDLSYPRLKDYSEELKRRLKRLEGVSQVTIDGFTDRQLRIELDFRALRSIGLSVAEVTAIIRSLNLDLPLGDLETGNGYLAIRVDDERTTPQALKELILAPGPNGKEIRLGDIATVSDTFQFPNQRITFDGHPAAMIRIEKSRSDDVLDTMAEIRKFIELERQRVPGIQLALTRNVASLVEDRLSMLVRNGFQGLLLVMLVLWLFFSARHAFWVGLGLPVSFAGAFALMAIFDYQFDMMTLVALLVAIGILVDDAVVVSENIAAHRSRGKDAVSASVDGALEVFPGVFASFVTTACIFTPLAFLSGDIGAVLKVVPVIILMTLAVSFIEAFLILPAHLRHSRVDDTRTTIQQWASRQLDKWRDYLVSVWVARVVRWRYLFFGGLTGIFLLTIGVLSAGIMGFTPLPELDNEVIEARLLLPQGTPIERTQARVDRILAGLDSIDKELTPQQPGERRLVRHVSVHYGKNVDAYETGDHVATVSVDLLDPEVRKHTSAQIRQRWRQAVGPLPDVIFLKYTDPIIGPQGKALDIRVMGENLPRLQQAADELYGWLARYDGVHDLSTDLRPGKPEIRITLKAGAQELGVTTRSIAEQLRGAFFGLTSSEVQVDAEHFEIDIRLDKDARSSFETLDGFMIRTDDGRLVPLVAVAHLEPARGYARLNRIDGQRAVSIEGQIDQQTTTSMAVLGDLEQRFLPEWRDRYPGLSLDIGGETEQAELTFDSLRSGFALGFLGIFLLLSFQFRSYVEPIVVVLIIPFSLIGVVVGHALMGYNLTMPSMLGFVSLAGIAVNNSILLVTFVEKRLAEGMQLQEAVVKAAHDRFRPILLTGITTVAGLSPLLLETSMQAQIVIPLALSLAFGLTTATLLTLFVIPAFYMVLQDFKLFRRHDVLEDASAAGVVE